MTLRPGRRPAHRGHGRRHPRRGRPGLDDARLPARPCRPAAAAHLPGAHASADDRFTVPASSTPSPPRRGELAAALRSPRRRPAGARPGPGHRARVGRQHGQHAGHLASPRPRHGPQGGLAGGRRAGRHERRRHLLVRGIDDRLLRAGAGAAPRRSRAAVRLVLSALRQPNPSAGRSIARLVGAGFPAGYADRRRGGARLPGTDLAGGRRLDPDGPGLARRARCPTASRRRELPARFLGPPKAPSSSRSATLASDPTATAHRVGALDLATALRRRWLDRRTPTRRHESRRQVGQRREHEQPLGGRGMGHVEPLGTPARAGSSLRPCRRSLDVDPVAAEDEQVEVELARSPTPAGLTTEGALEALECEQER